MKQIGEFLFNFSKLTLCSESRSHNIVSVETGRFTLCKLGSVRHPVIDRLTINDNGLYIPYRLIKSRWLVGTDDLFTVETIHSSRVSKFWIFFRNFGLGAGYSIG